MDVWSKLLFVVLVGAFMVVLFAGFMLLPAPSEPGRDLAAETIAGVLAFGLAGRVADTLLPGRTYAAGLTA